MESRKGVEDKSKHGIGNRDSSQGGKLELSRVQGQEQMIG